MAVLGSVLDKISAVISTMAAVGAVVVSYLNFKKIQDVHVLINSRMTELLKVTGIASKAEGREEERDKNAKQ